MAKSLAKALSKGVSAGAKSVSKGSSSAGKSVGRSSSAGSVGGYVGHASSGASVGRAVAKAPKIRKANASKASKKLGKKIGKAESKHQEKVLSKAGTHFATHTPLAKNLSRATGLSRLAALDAFVGRSIPGVTTNGANIVGMTPSLRLGLAAAAAHGANISIHGPRSGFRTDADQAYLLAHPDGGPVAAVGQSPHQKGLGVDLTVNGNIAAMGKYGIGQPVANDPEHWEIVDPARVGLKDPGPYGAKTASFPGNKPSTSLAVNKKPTAKFRPQVAKKLGLDSEQSKIAATILKTGRKKGASKQALISSMETARTEANFGNPAGGDGTSVGWRQEIDTYGSPKKRMNVKGAAKRYFAEAKEIGDQGSAGELAQAVQRSAYPERYGEHEAEATALVKGLHGKVPKIHPSGVPQNGPLMVRASVTGAQAKLKNAGKKSKEKSKETKAKASKGSESSRTASADPVTERAEVIKDFILSGRDDADAYVELGAQLRGLAPTVQDTLPTNKPSKKSKKAVNFAAQRGAKRSVARTGGRHGHAKSK